MTVEISEVAAAEVKRLIEQEKLEGYVLRVGVQGGGFKFVNPNAKSTCGCGSSFA